MNVLDNVREKFYDEKQRENERREVTSAVCLSPSINRIIEVRLITDHLQNVHHPVSQTELSPESCERGT